MASCQYLDLGRCQKPLAAISSQFVSTADTNIGGEGGGGGGA